MFRKWSLWSAEVTSKVEGQSLQIVNQSVVWKKPCVWDMNTGGQGSSRGQGPRVGDTVPGPGPPSPWPCSVGQGLAVPACGLSGMLRIRLSCDVCEPSEGTVLAQEDGLYFLRV